MKSFAMVLSFILSSSVTVKAKSLHLAGYVPLTAEVQVKHDKNGQLIVSQPGYNKLKLINVKKRQLASMGPAVSTIILEAP